jgi:hypothetical protein
LVILEVDGGMQHEGVFGDNDGLVAEGQNYQFGYAPSPRDADPHEFAQNVSLLIHLA